jgi:hypothetical protein
LQSHQALKWRG